MLPKLGSVIRKATPFHTEGYAWKSVTISQNASGTDHVSILYEYEIEIQSKPIETVMGLDFSLSELYITDTFEHDDYPRYDRPSLEKRKRMQRSLSKMTRYSRNDYKQEHKIAKRHEHIANQRKDFQHKPSRLITHAFDGMAREHLNRKAMQKALNFAKSVRDNVWGRFVSFLQYKLAEQGQKLVKMDKCFPSSKTCSIFGEKKNELFLVERLYVCECGNIMSRDRNATIHIKQEAMRRFGMV